MAAAWSERSAIVAAYRAELQHRQASVANAQKDVGSFASALETRSSAPTRTTDLPTSATIGAVVCAVVLGLYGGLTEGKGKGFEAGLHGVLALIGGGIVGAIVGGAVLGPLYWAFQPSSWRKRGDKSTIETSMVRARDEHAQARRSVRDMASQDPSDPRWGPPEPQPSR